jgi:hypothetical protein
MAIVMIVMFAIAWFIHSKTSFGQKLRSSAPTTTWPGSRHQLHEDPDRRLRDLRHRGCGGGISSRRCARPRPMKTARVRLLLPDDGALGGVQLSGGKGSASARSAACWPTASSTHPFSWIGWAPIPSIWAGHHVPVHRLDGHQFEQEAGRV